MRVCSECECVAPNIAPCLDASSAGSFCGKCVMIREVVMTVCCCEKNYVKRDDEVLD